MLHQTSLHRNRVNCRDNRRGVVLPLVGIMLLVLMALASIGVDVAYMQLVRSELRAATDAAAKAGTIELTRTNGDINAAKTAAVLAASRNKVGGRSLTLSAGDVEVGRSTLQANGTWAFTANQTPLTAVKVNVDLSDTTTAGSRPLFFAGAIGHDKFATTQSAIASQLDIEVCLCIDRSHSMCFDLSGVDWRYPSGYPRNADPYDYAPRTTGSRWASLTTAVDTFVTKINQMGTQPRVALVTWSSDISRNSYEGRMLGRSQAAAMTEAGLSTNYSNVQNLLAAKYNYQMYGSTNMSAGIDAGVVVLTAANVRPMASRVLVLMSDGQWNSGRNPALAAADAASRNVIIHTISFIEQSGSSAMQQVADITGGRHYHATSQQELQDAFTQIALTLPIVLTK